jgi:cytochrome c biogenesis protein CcdA/thiol-disulfide isomerase/thioredoxin
VQTSRADPSLPRLARPVALVVIAIAVLGAVVAAAAPAGALAATTDDPTTDDPDVVVEVYWGDGCPYCEDALEHLVPFAEGLDGVEVAAFEVWYDPVGRARMQERAAELGVRGGAVPFIVVGDASWVGFSASIGAQIEQAVLAALEPEPEGPPAPADPPAAAPQSPVVDVPLVGAVDLEGRSLLVATVLIGLVDGLNPCSLWVLTVLLALVLHSGSRRRVAAIGGTFLLVTTLIYGAFITGVYSALSIISSLDWIRLVVAAFALTFGLVNVKDFLWFKAGPSLTIPDDRKPSIYRRARGLVRPGTALPAAVAGTVVLAGGVALVELPCTAGFPVIWSDLVNAAGVSGPEFAALLGVYLGIYLLDELVVFGAAIITMRATRLEERHGRALKLVGGMLMIAIGVTIVAVPDALDTVGGLLAVFAAAIAASALVAGLDRIVRPGVDRARHGTS